MSATDAMIATLSSEIEERRAFQDQLVEGAQAAGRDLTAQEMELYQRAGDRIRSCAEQLEPLAEGVRIATQSANRSRELADAYREARAGSSGNSPAPVEYRSAGAYVIDRWAAGSGDESAKRRVEMYERAAAHQTTADNLGVVPDPIVGTVLNLIDGSRPIVTALGVRAIPSGRFNRPKVTQQADTGLQAGEKTELASRKMTITNLPVAMDTYGGYVNVSRQNIDWSMPQIMDIVIESLANEYARDTEGATGTALGAAATAGPTLPTGANTADQVLAAIWGAAADAYTATGGVGGLVLAIPPGMLSLVGPLFPPYNPSNAGGIGFTAGGFSQGAVGTISGIGVVMSDAVAVNTMLLINTACAECYEQRVGSLQVVEPSVLGVQVAYAGYFHPLVLEAGGVIKIVKTP